MGARWEHKGVTRDLIEIVITFPSVGARTRFLCNPHTVTSDDVIEYGPGAQAAGWLQDTWLAAGVTQTFFQIGLPPGSRPAETTTWPVWIPVT